MERERKERILVNAVYFLFYFTISAVAYQYAKGNIVIIISIGLFFGLISNFVYPMLKQNKKPIKEENPFENQAYY